MKTQIIKLTGFFLILSCIPPAKAGLAISQETLQRPITCFLEEAASSPLRIASDAFYQTQVAKLQPVQLLRKPMTTWLLLRVVPPQLPAYKVTPLWLLGLMIVILPGIILRTLYKKNV